MKRNSRFNEDNDEDDEYVNTRLETLKRRIFGAELFAGAEENPSASVASGDGPTRDRAGSSVATSISSSVPAPAPASSAEPPSWRDLVGCNRSGQSDVRRLDDASSPSVDLFAGAETSSTSSVSFGSKSFTTSKADVA